MLWLPWQQHSTSSAIMYTASSTLVPLGSRVWPHLGVADSRKHAGSPCPRHVSKCRPDETRPSHASIHTKGKGLAARSDKDTLAERSRRRPAKTMGSCLGPAGKHSLQAILIQNVFCASCEARVLLLYGTPPARSQLLRSSSAVVHGSLSRRCEYRRKAQRSHTNSATGTRNWVARARAEYPNQLDYSGSRMMPLLLQLLGVWVRPTDPEAE